MGRVDKRLQIAKKLKKDKDNISKDAVAKTLENEKKKPVEFRTIDLIKSSNTEVKLLLEKPSKKNLLHRVQQVSKSVNKVTKKDKLKLRKDNLKQRLQVQKIIKDEEIASKRRKKKVITGI